MKSVLDDFPDGIKLARLFWVLCFVFGVGVMGLVAWLAWVTPSQACSGQPTTWTSPFLAFQLGRTTDDIEAVFGRGDDPCRTGMVAAFDPLRPRAWPDRPSPALAEPLPASP